MILGRLADVDGPRCRKRIGYIAVPVAVPYINDLLGSNMQAPEEVTCGFFR